MAKISEQAAATAPEGVEPGKQKRSLQMKQLLGPQIDTLKAKLALARAENKPQAEQELVCGVIAGPIYEVRERNFENPKTGETITVLQAIGEFEGVSAITGEVLTSSAADLPGYYLEGVQVALKVPGTKAVLCAVEIILVATGKSIPVAYEVKNLMPLEPDSPLNRIKLALQKSGRLGKLSAPVPMVAIEAPKAPALDNVAEDEANAGQQ